MRKNKLHLSVLRRVLILAFIIVLQNNSMAYTGCNTNNFDNAYGPYDYTDKQEYEKKLPIVEAYHFSPEKERTILLGGGNLLPRNIMKDLDYTLRACPNHHRALNAVATYMTHLKNNKPEKYRWLSRKYRTPECYFERAAAYNKKDHVPYILYGMYLYKEGKQREALEKLELALSRSKEKNVEDSELYYILGLIYLKQEEYSESIRYAKKAYSLGYPLPFLKNKLKELGKWDD